MSNNLLTSGFVDLKQLPLDQLKLEVSQLLSVPLQNIECLELWPNQIWVKFFEGRGLLISYRRLPMWAELGLAAINSCTDSSSLQQIGEILLVERDWFNQTKEPELIERWQKIVEVWREAWAKKAREIKVEEERTRPQREHQQAAEIWLLGWQQVLSFCKDCQAVNRLAGEIEIQGQEFKDLPQIIRAIKNILQQRWQELMPNNGHLDFRF
ncbi:MAG: hypothetical protein WA919_16670 [Coleofasciculaceae cyanobacterium]